MKLSTIGAGRVLRPTKIPGTYFCYRLSEPRGHIATVEVSNKYRVKIKILQHSELKLCIILQVTIFIKTEVSSSYDKKAVFDW
jgi:hypothetical protein